MLTGGKVAVVGDGVDEIAVDPVYYLAVTKRVEPEDLLEGPSPTSDTAQTNERK